MSMALEFKEFLSRGSVVDLAVGVVIGGAFGKITSTLVDKVIMPPIGLLLGGVDFATLKIVLKPADAAKKAAEVAIGYGEFINVCIDFLIIALVVFLIVRAYNHMKRDTPAEPAAPAGPSAEETLLGEIRDLLAART